MKQLLASLGFILLISCSDDDPVDSVAVAPPGIPCVGGMADDYPCNGYDLMGIVSLEEMQASAGNDIWGWTDAQTGSEYALVGLDNGTAFIDITDAAVPVYLGKLPTRTVNAVWRDIKVYRDHAFIVSEARDHGLQVFDLTRLREASPGTTFTADAENLDFGAAHNIAINEDSGFAYVIGANTFEGGPHFIDIRDPANPVSAGGYAGDGYTHDAQIVNYFGPDSDYTGREIFAGSNEDTVTLLDVTDKNNPVLISSISYPNPAYTHQGWFTEDQRYFIANDELDEINFGFNTRTLIFDFSDLDNPQITGTYSGPTQAIDHNHYVKGNLLYMSSYTAGFRVVDISGVGNADLSEVGFFDTYPSSNGTQFNGSWSNYPFFASGNIIISDMSGGLFIVRKSGS